MQPSMVDALEKREEGMRSAGKYGMEENWEEKAYYRGVMLENMLGPASGRTAASRLRESD